MPLSLSLSALPPTQPLSLDYLRAQAPLYPRNRPIGWFALILGIGTLSVAISDYSDAIAGATTVTGQLDRLHVRQLRSPAAMAVPTTVQAGIRQAAAFSERAGFPWERCWQAIEESRRVGERGTADIALLTVELNPVRGEIAIAGEARDVQALSGFADALAGHDTFKDVTLTQHKLSEGEPPAVVRFDLRLSLNVPVPLES